MRLVIGGQGQGKLQYVLNKTKLDRSSVFDGNDSKTEVCAPVFDHLHLFVRKMMQENADVWGIIESIRNKNKDIIFICDEIGCGVVPSDPFEREWREMTGRVCCFLAKHADSVTRVFCGIGTTISGDDEWN